MLALAAQDPFQLGSEVVADAFPVKKVGNCCPLAANIW
jgi:hypothetical protein